MGNDIVNILNKNTGSSNDGINFRQAISNTKEDCFRLSGCERLLEYLKRELGNDTPILMDFSALPSSFDSNNRLADFIAIYDPSRDNFKPISLMNKAYHQVYDSLGIGGRNLGMFYKKEFFYASETSSYYYSDTPLQFPYPIDNDINVDNKTQEESWKDLSQYNVYFVNKSFKLSYRQYVDNLMNDNNAYDCQQRNDILLFLYNEYFTRGKKGNLLSVPLIGFPGKRETGKEFFEGLGAIFIYFISNKELDDSKIHKIANDIWFIGLQVTYNSMFQIAYELSETVRLESIKSAIAAIMSRNMSHNLGSHFISNTKNYFSALIDRGEGNTADYRGIKHALQYIQERMDFIATITSTDIYPYGAVNAKAQFFDELTPDDFGERHSEPTYNYLLDYLVLSEKISKRSWRSDIQILSAGDHKMSLQIAHWGGTGDVEYWNSTCISKEENNRRDEILGINFAIPGGILGRHALFSIVENIIRNSAKHGQGIIKDTFVVRILYRTDQQRLIIFDNKEDKHIKSTINGLKNRLKKMQFLKNGQLDQDNKGLKEMLVCAIWLQNMSVAQVMTDNDSEQDEDKRLRNIEQYIKVVAVNNVGVEFVPDEKSKGYLGYSIKLDTFERVHYLEESEIKQGLNNIKADVICYYNDIEVGGKKLSDIFPRFLKITPEEKNKVDEAEILERVVEQNCPNTVHKKMVVSYTVNLDYGNDMDVIMGGQSPEEDVFLFMTHAAKSKWEKFSALFLTKGFEDKYVDAISGGDFTSTLIQPSFVKDRFNLLKIKESVATPFIIIDERIFEHYKTNVIMSASLREIIKTGLANLKTNFHGEQLNIEIAKYVFKERSVLGTGVYDSHKQELEDFVSNTNTFSLFLEKDIDQHFLDRRRIYVLNLDICEGGFKMTDLSANECTFSWRENKFDNNKNHILASSSKNDNTTSFLSIHLGLIDKIKDYIMNVSNVEDTSGMIIDTMIVETIKKFFNAKFVSIHSGRGGFDIRESLKQYAFQSFSSIENPLYNSKYLLSQQFHNIMHYGTETF